MSEDHSMASAWRKCSNYKRGKMAVVQKKILTAIRLLRIFHCYFYSLASKEYLFTYSDAQHRGEARNLLRGGQKTRSGGRKSQRVQGLIPGGGLWAKPPETGDTC